MLESIREHFNDHVHSLDEFLGKGFNHVKIPGNLPLYNNKFRDVVHYTDLYKEIKIGKFYARLWVKNAVSIDMTQGEQDQFYKKVIEIVKENIDPTYLRESEENLQSGVKNLGLCARMIIKLNDVFNFKRIISIEILDQIIGLENKNQNRNDIWELIT